MLPAESVIVAATTFTVLQLNRPAQAQSGGQIVAANIRDAGACIEGTYASGAVLLSNGDLFSISIAEGCVGRTETIFVGNIWTGLGAVNVKPSTWSEIKTKLGTPGN